MHLLYTLQIAVPIFPGSTDGFQKHIGGVENKPQSLGVCRVFRMDTKKCTNHKILKMFFNQRRKAPHFYNSRCITSSSINV